MRTSLLEVIGRVMLSFIFLRGGWMALVSPGTRIDSVARARLPEPELLVRANGLVMVAGGCMLAIGALPEVVPLVLVVSLLATTVVGHAFWLEKGPSRNRQIIQFLKNIGLIGGLLLVVASAVERPGV